MHWVEKPGPSLEAMRRITSNAKKIRGLFRVCNFGSHIGQAEFDGEAI